MFDYTVSDIDKYLSRIKALARRAVERGDWVGALRHVDNAAWMVYNINHIYADAELEQIVARVSSALAGGESVKSAARDPRRWLFYDQIGNDTVLALQYIRALSELVSHRGDEILYVLEPGQFSRPARLLPHIEPLPGVRVAVLDSSLESRVRNFGSTLGMIRDFGASRALIHSPAGGAFGVALLGALEGVIRYRIVPGDHHFWLGVSVTDYALEFRRFGAVVAVERRGFRPDQILHQPYYPLADKTDTGSANERLVIYSGGSYSKILGGGGAYFSLVGSILDRNPEAIVKFNGGGTPRNRLAVRRAVRRHGLGNRFLLDGFTGDVSARMSECDIYLGTWPLCGGLMSQFAAAAGRPVVQYCPSGDWVNRVEDILGVPDGVSFATPEQVVDRVTELARDPEARRAEGKRLQRALLTPDQFRDRLEVNLFGPGVRFPDSDSDASDPPMRIDYARERSRYLELMSRFGEGIERRLVAVYRLRAAWLFPKAFVKFIVNIRFMAAWFLERWRA